MAILLEGQTYNDPIDHADSGHATVRVSTGVAETLIFRNNAINSIETAGYLFDAGDENPGSTNGNLDGSVITGNKMAWTGTPGAPITHGMFMGYMINNIVKHNYMDGTPYGIIFKSGTDAGVNRAFTSGGAFYNIVKNNKISVRMKGINGVPIYNNTFYCNGAAYTSVVYIDPNNDRAIPAASTGAKIKNNIFHTVNQMYNINLATIDCRTGFESDYNVFYCEGGVPLFNIAGTSYTFLQWQALGYDTHSIVLSADPFVDHINFVPKTRMDYGTNLGASYQDGLSITAGWVVGTSPAPMNQNGAWQVGARLFASTVTQDDYYIDPNGSDAVGDGSQVAPWKTLSYACSRPSLKDGDIIHVNEGLYSESQRTILPPGISIKGAGKSITIMTFSYAAVSYADGCIYAVSSSITNGDQFISDITFTTLGYASARCIFTRFRNNFIIHDVTISGFDKSGVNAYSTSYNAYTLIGGVVTLTDPTTVFTTGLEIYNCLFYDNTESPDNIGESNLRWSGHSGFYIHDNTFDNSVRVAPRNVYSDQVQNGVFDNNIIVTRETISGEWLFAMEMYSGRGGCIISNNTLEGGGTIDIAGYSIIKGIYDYSWYIHDNTLIISSIVPYNDKPTVGITIECHFSLQGVIVTRNRITNFPWGICVTIGKPGASVEDIDINANIIENSASLDVSWNSFGVGIIQQAATVTKTNINIINNTITGNQPNSFRGVYISVDGTIVGVNVKNNIIQGFIYGIRLDNYSGTIDSLEIMNNLINACLTNLSIQAGAGINYATYVNSGELPSDPLFQAIDNYRLKASSPAIGTGVAVVGVDLDYDGREYSSPRARGGFEYVAVKKLTTINIVGGSPVHLMAKPSWIRVQNNADDSILNVGDLITDGMVLAISPNEENAGGYRMGFIILSDSLPNPDELLIRVVHDANPNAPTVALYLSSDPSNTIILTSTGPNTTSPGLMYLDINFTPFNEDLGDDVYLNLYYSFTKNGVDAGSGSWSGNNNVPFHTQLLLSVPVVTTDSYEITVWST